MKIIERCSCGASCDADDQPMLISNSSGSEEVNRGTRKWPDGSGSGFASDFVERWRGQHACMEKDDMQSHDFGAAR